MDLDFLKPLIEGLIRRALTAIGGVLVGAGIISDADWVTVSAGLLTIAVTYIWGLIRSDIPRANPS